MLVSDAVAAYIDDRRGRAEITQRSADQLRWRLGGLARACPGRHIAELDIADLHAWQRTVAADRPASRRAYLSTVRVFMAWCLDAGLLEADPSRRLGRIKEPRRTPRALSAAQMARLRLVLPDDEARLIVALMAVQGLRCVEVARLDAGDYDPGRRRLWVQGKADNERHIAVADRVAEPLERWLAGRATGPVIGRTPANLSRLLRRWMTRAGLKGSPYDGRSAHALRHTAASDLYDASDGDIRVVQRFLGHANVATTDRYLRQGDDEKTRAALNRPA